WHPLHADRAAAAHNHAGRLRGAPHLQQSALAASAVAESAGAEFLLPQCSSSGAAAAVVSVAAAASRGLLRRLPATSGLRRSTALVRSLPPPACHGSCHR